MRGFSRSTAAVTAATVAVLVAMVALVTTSGATSAAQTPTRSTVAPEAARALSYQVIDLGPFDGYESSAVDLNDHGDVVGTINPAWDDRAFRVLGGRTEIWGDPDHYLRPVALNRQGAALVTIDTRRMPHSERIALWNGSTRTVLNPPGTWATGAGDLADSGRAVIVYGPDQLTQDTVALVEDGQITRAQRFPGWTVGAPTLTSTGLVAGTLSTPNQDNSRAFVWDGTRVTHLPDGTFLRALTERGQLFGDGPHGPFSWYRGTTTPLRPPSGSTSTRLTDANVFGTAVGETRLADNTQRAVEFVNGRASLIPTLGGTWNRALLVNDRGEVAGISETASGAWHGFHWRAGRLTDLGTLPAVTEQAVQWLMAINNRGQILGNSQISPSQYTRATLWSPAVH